MHLRLVGIFLIMALAAGCSSGSPATVPDYEIQMSSSYNRQAGQLVLEVYHSADADIQVNFVTPLWVTLEITQTRELADGRLLMDLDVVMEESGEDITQVTIIATDDFGTRSSRDIIITRPVYVTASSASAGPGGVQVDVTVDAPGTNGVEVTITPPAGFGALISAVQTGTGNSNYTFHLAYPAGEYLAGGNGTETVHIRARDDLGHESFHLAEFTYDIAAPAVPAHSLAAIPLKTSARVDEPVLVAVVSGGFPAGQEFLHLNSCGVTFDGDVNYIWPSFNCGLPGGEYDAVDGIWSLIAPTGLESGLEGQPNPHRVQIDGGTYRLDFGIGAHGGSAVTQGGVLFTFEASFGTAGDVRLGFQEFEHVNRTCYSDGDSAEHNWADVGNDYPGLPNSITVAE